MPTARKKPRAKTSARGRDVKKRPARPKTAEKAVTKARSKPAKKASAPVRSPAAGSPPAQPAPAAPVKAAPVKAAPSAPAKKSRRSGLSQRRGPGGQLLAPGEILLPGGPQTSEEVQYLIRGCVAAERPAVEPGIAEIIAKRPSGDLLAERPTLDRYAQAFRERFDGGAIEAMLPPRILANRRNFASVAERAKLRRREIGAFLRGLHLGHTDTAHMDSHGEDSLQKLMEWAARLENLSEAEEPDQADYTQFHRGLDHLENTTEALIVDVEATLRRLRDRAR
jgi:hypothetical protein